MRGSSVNKGVRQDGFRRGTRTDVIARERLALDYDLMPALDVRLVEGGHDQVQVRRQRLHDGYLGRAGPDDGRHHLGRPGVHVQPGRQGGAIQRLEVALNALGRPRVEILPDAGCRAPGLKAERVAAEVGAGPGLHGQGVVVVGGIWLQDPVSSGQAGSGPGPGPPPSRPTVVGLGRERTWTLQPGASDVGDRGDDKFVPRRPERVALVQRAGALAPCVRNHGLSRPCRLN